MAMVSSVHLALFHSIDPILQQLASCSALQIKELMLVRRFLQQKIVIKLGVPNAKNRSKAMQLASKFVGTYTFLDAVCMIWNEAWQYLCRYLQA